MKLALLILWVALCAFVVATGYIRLAPTDPDDWDVPLDFSDDSDEGGIRRVVETGPDGLARLDPIIRATPRTRLLAGGVAEGRATYVTRSAVIGFPDYTTIEQDGDVLKIFARQRFGRSDFGVNETRVTGWLNALQP